MVSDTPAAPILPGVKCSLGKAWERPKCICCVSNLHLRFLNVIMTNADALRYRRQAVRLHIHWTTCLRFQLEIRSETLCGTKGRKTTSSVRAAE